jgi:flagellar motor switch protein FliN
MSTMTIPTDVIAKMELAATALTEQLSADSGWTIEAEPSPTEIEGSRVVVASLGAEARISLMMVSPFARGLIVGPPPADSLEEALEPGFAAAAKALGPVLDRPLTLGALTESTPDEAISSMGGATQSFRLIDGDKHVASFVIATSFDVAPEPDVETPVFDQIPESNAPLAHHPVSMLADVEMGVTVELGRAKMSVAEILSLTIGSVIELDRLAGSPVDVLVNGTLIARGEVVVIDEEFGVRVSEVLGYEPTDRNRR